MNKKVLSIVVFYNGEKWVDYCLNSLVNSDYPTDIICIDNNSSDNTIFVISSNFPNVELIKSEINLGFGKANNIGLKKVLEMNYDYAFLLNQDARIEADTIGKLISTHKNNTHYGVLSPIHRSKDNNILDHNFSCYLKSDNTKDLTSDFVLNKTIKDVYQTDFVNAALWLISKECIEKIGYFDPIFPHYGEDDDYLFRVNSYGLKVGIVPSALGNHARYQVKQIRKYEDFNGLINRKYISLLIRYKKNTNGSFKKNIFFLRELIINIFSDLIKLDPSNLKINLIIYTKLFKAIW